MAADDALDPPPNPLVSSPGPINDPGYQIDGD